VRDSNQPIDKKRVTMTTRAAKVKTLKYLLSMASLTSDEQDYVTGVVSNPEQLVVVHNQDQISKMLGDDTRLSPMSRLLVTEVAEFIESYVNVKGNYSGLDEISEAEWDQHINRRAAVVSNLAAMPTEITSKNRETGNKCSVKLSDFPTFNGQSADWPTFHTKFTSAIGAYKMDDVLEENSEHELKISTDPKYKEQCKLIYNLLNLACAQGDANAKVLKHESTKDGYLVWQDLNKYYFAKGNVDAYASDNTAKIANLRLDYNTPGGID